ncbi:MAG: hypothetical protein QGH66_06420, partial [Dehalococcoidia bacterium]|nr:hypothetical protein [Dehalococcoidia bacterium]
FEARGNFIGMYADPPRLGVTMRTQNGRWTPEELAELMPKALAGSLKELPTSAEQLLAPDATGWELTGGQLKQIQAFLPDLARG